MSKTNKNMPKIIVIGGGATGCGVARDLVLRGYQTTLIEFGDLGSGTTSRFHGMLQSGARYVASDNNYAAECYRMPSIAKPFTMFVPPKGSGMLWDAVRCTLHAVRCALR